MKTAQLGRTPAVGALALAAAGVLTATSTAAAAIPPAHSSLSIRSVRSNIRAGQHDTISGVLRSGGGDVRYRRIELEDRTGSNGWAVETSKAATARGYVAFRESPTTTTHYRLLFPGAPRLARSHSGIVTLNVLQPGNLTIDVAQRAIDRGASDTVSGVLTNDAGQPVVGDVVRLRARRVGQHHGRWIEHSTTGNDGSVSFTVTPKVTTFYHLVASAVGGQSKVVSHRVRIAVRRPSSLSIREHAAGSDMVISGTLHGAGHALARRQVDLQSSTDHGSSWNDLATGTTRKGGGVRFTQPTPTQQTEYRLSFSGGPKFESSVSAVLTEGPAAGA